jgi:hypothetical protein
MTRRYAQTLTLSVDHHSKYALVTAEHGSVILATHLTNVHINMVHLIGNIYYQLVAGALNMAKNYGRSMSQQ